MIETRTMEFHCHICEERSETLCRWCTKDSCGNHLCAKCARCSDCCDCDETKITDEIEEVRV